MLKISYNQYVKNSYRVNNPFVAIINVNIRHAIGEGCGKDSNMQASFGKGRGDTYEAQNPLCPILALFCGHVDLLC